MKSAVDRAMTPAEWSLLLALSVLWGGSFFFTGVAVKALPPLTIVALRVTLAALVLWAALPLFGQRMPRDGASWRAFLGMSILGNAVPFCLIVWGQTHIASGLASILNATTPLTTVVVAHFLTTDERMTGRKLAGVLLGFAGVVGMLGPDMLAGLGDQLLAQAAVLGAALSYAFAGVFGRRFRRMGISPVASATGQVTSAALLLLPLSLLVDRPWHLPLPGAEVFGAVIGIAVLSTALAYIVFFRVLGSAGATNLSLVTFLIPPSAILLGSLVLGETLLPQHWAGMALIGLGLAVIDGRLLARLPFRTGR